MQVPTRCVGLIICHLWLSCWIEVATWIVNSPTWLHTLLVVRTCGTAVIYIRYLPSICVWRTGWMDQHSVYAYNLSLSINYYISIMFVHFLSIPISVYHYLSLSINIYYHLCIDVSLYRCADVSMYVRTYGRMCACMQAGIYVCI